MSLLLESSFEEPFFKKARTSDFVVSVVHPEGVNIVDDENVEVVCVSQNVRSLSDPEIAERLCIVANSEAEGPSKMGTRLEDYMYFHHSQMLLICFEAFKILDQGFTEIQKGFGGVRENRRFVRNFSKIAEKAALKHKVPIPKDSTWVESIPFGVFAEGVSILYDCTLSSESEAQKISALKKDAESFFKYVVSEGIDSLKEESCNLGVSLIDFESLKQSPVEDLVKEWVSSARNRAMRNSFGHPFGSGSPESLRKASLKIYNMCLEHDITKEFRNVALLGRVKLEINEKRINQDLKIKTSVFKASEVLMEDESDDESAYLI